MKTITEQFVTNRIFDFENYIAKTDSDKKIGYFDIETTGLSAKNSSIYMIGFANKNENGSFDFIQWFNDNDNDEFKMLLMFREYIKDFDMLVDFNGTTFDVPFIENRGKLYNIDFNFERFEFIDLYREIKGYKSFFKTENLKQKTIELFLNINRDDTYSGGELITFYKNYVKNGSKDTEAADFLMLHNHDDIIGMVEIMDIYPYTRLTKENFNIASLDIKADNLLVKLKFDFKFKTNLTDTYNSITLKLEEDTMSLLIPVEHGIFKHFYDNYKDYFYIPLEDEAIHKSIGQYMDKDSREKATKENCYTKRESNFIVQFEKILTPDFKLNYNDKISFSEITTDILEDYLKNPVKNNLFKEYIEHLINIVRTKP